ncbi:MAG: sulfite dehydrogenase [Gemmatimonadaceae bacterium]
MKKNELLSRRAMIAGAAAAAGGALLKQVVSAEAQESPGAGDPSRAPGTGTTAVGARSAFENPARSPTGVLSGSSLTPLQSLTGTITPGDLVFERHHSGIPAIDPSRYKLVIHGMAARAMTFTLDDLRRLPSVSRVHFLECSGNGRAAYRAPAPGMTPQNVDGLTSNGEWTGVPLSVLLREVDARSTARWVLAEGGDSNKLSRSIPLEKAMDDAMIAYAFNGEPLRPANGYPARLFLPGYEGNTCVKWLRRLELVDQPNMSKDETSKYTDPLPNGTARQFSFLMDAKSIITSPAAIARVERGWMEISGIAWSGRGRIARVDVSTDGGRRWTMARLQEPVLSRAHTRFRHAWEWNGRATTIMSRAVDETGAIQPTRAAFRATRGPGTDYHFNFIRVWKIASDGAVTFEGDA